MCYIKQTKKPTSKSKLQRLQAFNIRVVVSSATQQTGIDEIASIITPGTTAVFLGSSGVGKSTIINLLLGENKQPTHEVREADSKVVTQRRIESYLRCQMVGS
ncbi:GTPase RsgA [Candidatus Saccharibacteria bacterium]|nr:MAG: GTPase RsgA [Candidatus Saccharibacteria bacterium]